MVAFLAWPKLVKHCQSASKVGWDANASRASDQPRVTLLRVCTLAKSYQWPEPHAKRNCNGSYCPQVFISDHFCLFSIQKKSDATFLCEGNFPTTINNRNFGPPGLLWGHATFTGTVSVVCTCDKQVCKTSSNLISSFESKCAARCNQKEHAEQRHFSPEEE